MSKIFSMLKQADKEKQKYSRAVEQGQDSADIPVAGESKKASKFTVLVMIVLAVGVSVGMLYMFGMVQQVSSEVAKLSDKVNKMQQSVESGSSQAKTLSTSVQQVDTHIKEARAIAESTAAKVGQMEKEFARYKAEDAILKQAAVQAPASDAVTQLQSDIEELKRKVYFLLLSNAKGGSSKK